MRFHPLRRRFASRWQRSRGYTAARTGGSLLEVGVWGWRRGSSRQVHIEEVEDVCDDNEWSIRLESDSKAKQVGYTQFSIPSQYHA